MGIKQPKPEAIVTKLGYVDLLCGQGMARVDAIREVQITEQTFYLYGRHCQTNLIGPVEPTIEVSQAAS